MELLSLLLIVSSTFCALILTTSGYGTASATSSKLQHRRSLNVISGEQGYSAALTSWPHLKHHMEGFVGERRFILECPIVIIANSDTLNQQKHQKLLAIVWYHNNIHIPISSSHSSTSSRVRQLPTGDLVINRLRYTDAGTYTCRSTVNQNVSHSISVEVVDPRLKARQFEMDDENGAMLLADQPQESSAAGERERSAPRFVSRRDMQHHQQHVVPTSGTAQFNCAATGWPLPVTEWYHNGQRVDVQQQQQNNVRALLTDSRGQTLTFNNLHTQDEGNFTCVVRNELGAITFAYQVRVTSPSNSLPAAAFIDSAGMTNQTELVNTTATFECRVRPPTTSADPPTQVNWFKTYKINGAFTAEKTSEPLIHLINTTRIRLTPFARRLDEHNANQFYFASSLHIKNLTFNDSAFYICVIPSAKPELRPAYLRVVKTVHDLPRGHLLYESPHKFYLSPSTYSSFYQWLILFIVVGICIAISVVFVGIVYWRFRLWRESPLKCAPQQTVLFRKRIIIDRIGTGANGEELLLHDAASLNTQLTNASSPTMTTLLSGGGSIAANSQRIGGGTLSASASMMSSASAAAHPRMFFPRVRIEKVSFRSSMPSTELTSLSEYDMPVNPEWEFPRECIRLHEEVGQGAFGRVVRAEAFRIRRAKTANSTTAPTSAASAQTRKVSVVSTPHNETPGGEQNTYFNDPIVSINSNRWRRKSRTPSMQHHTAAAATGLRLLSDEDYLATYHNSTTTTTDVAGTPKSPCSSSSNSNSATSSSSATHDSNWTIVAVKMLKDDGGDREMKALVTELELMMEFGTHPNIVNLLGCCTQGGALWVVVEYAPYGNLRNFLYKHRTYLDYERAIGMRTLEPSDLVRYTWQIACGMEYIASKKWIHRDLAARNILVGEGEVMKIADFGLSRDVHDTKDVYVRGKYSDTKMPIKWMAPEVLFDGVYTSQSDVWSFAVVLWEIFSYGGQPYPSLAQNDLYEFLKSGKRMNAPEGCPPDVAQIMQQCWLLDATQRPTFSQLVERLESLQLRLNTNEQQLNSTRGGARRDAQPIPPMSSQLHRQIMHNQNLLYGNNVSAGAANQNVSTQASTLPNNPGVNTTALSTAGSSYATTTVVESAYLLP